MPVGSELVLVTVCVCTRRHQRSECAYRVGHRSTMPVFLSAALEGQYQQGVEALREVSVGSESVVGVTFLQHAPRHLVAPKVLLSNIA
jgi:hypothetical protein